jgi:uncharacterized membrane protein YeaQ/YmgE (transglycosylase-associated protein family)
MNMDVVGAFLIGVVAGAIASFFVVKNNHTLIMAEYAKLIATGKVVGGVVGTLATKIVTASKKV